MSYGPEGEAFFCDVCEDDPKRCNQRDCPGRDHPDSPNSQSLEAQGWHTVASMPYAEWCQTKRAGEDGQTESMWVHSGCMDEPREYWDRAGYSTIINPGSFAPPTHWKPLHGA